MWSRKKLVSDYVPPLCTYWDEKTRVVTPRGHGSQSVSYELVHSVKVSKQQLDPRTHTLEKQLEAGVVIQPGAVSTMLDITDPADLDELGNRFGQNVIDYVGKEENLKNIVKQNTDENAS